jgi:hypothetical protein
LQDDLDQYDQLIRTSQASGSRKQPPRSSKSKPLMSEFEEEVCKKEAPNRKKRIPLKKGSKKSKK